LSFVVKRTFLQGTIVVSVTGVPHPNSDVPFLVHDFIGRLDDRYHCTHLREPLVIVMTLIGCPVCLLNRIHLQLSAASLIPLLTTTLESVICEYCFFVFAMML
jgi:hypothetical protein